MQLKVLLSIILTCFILISSYAQTDSLAVEENYFDINSDVLPPRNDSMPLPKCLNLKEVQRMVEYPIMAVDAGITGKLKFRILIDENGNYVRHQAPEKGEPILIKAVERHLYKLKFAPFTIDGKAQKFWVQLPFNFELK